MTPFLPTHAACRAVFPPYNEFISVTGLTVLCELQTLSSSFISQPPCTKRTEIDSASPERAARCRGVEYLLPVSKFVSFAPASSSSFIILLDPFKQAQCNALFPLYKVGTVNTKSLQVFFATYCIACIYVYIFFQKHLYHLFITIKAGT